VKPKADDEETTFAARRFAARVRASASRRSRLHASAPADLVLAFLVGSLIAFAADPAHASEDLVIFPTFQVVYLVIGFALLIIPVNLLIFKPIFRALDERKARIEGARNRAKQIERDADRILRDYEERIRDARSEADVVRKEQIAAARDEHAALTASARSEAEGQIERARQSLTAELVTARASIGDHAQELARTAAEQILGRSIS
jgi:F-type H+-transporting ATPase subunit b